MDRLILSALARWVEDAERGSGESVLLDLVIDRPCPLCDGTTFCPAPSEKGEEAEHELIGFDLTVEICAVRGDHQ